MSRNNGCTQDSAQHSVTVPATKLLVLAKLLNLRLYCAPHELRFIHSKMSLGPDPARFLAHPGDALPHLLSAGIFRSWARVRHGDEKAPQVKSGRGLFVGEVPGRNSQSTLKRRNPLKKLRP